MEWMPIETAPELTPVLLYVPKGRYDVVSDTYGPIIVTGEYGLPNEWYLSTSGHYVRGATHWAPLPKPPAS